MTQLSISGSAKKDFFTSLGVWMALETVCFVCLPFLGLVQPDSTLQPWFYASFPAGLGGAFLIGLGSQFIFTTVKRNKGFIRFLKILLGEFVSLIGVTGIAFPLLVGSMELFATLFNSL